jgi:hypothetical protein
MAHNGSAFPRPAKIASRDWWALILAAPLLAVACGGCNPTPAATPTPGPVISLPLVEPIVGTPPDVPSSIPACDSTENLSLTSNNQTIATAVPAALQSVESTCSNYNGDNPEVMVIYNLTDDVLDISPANGTAPNIVPHFPAPSDLLPSWDDLEIEAQNEVVNTQQAQAPLGTYLIPVGGEAVIYVDAAFPPLDVYVQVDQNASALSYGTQLLTGYVTDNLVDKISVLSYLGSISDCANAAYSTLQNLNQQADAATTIITALQSYPACKELADKVHENSAETLATVKPTDDHALKSDLDKVADTAEADTWETGIEDLLKAAADIVEVGH